MKSCSNCQWGDPPCDDCSHAPEFDKHKSKFDRAWAEKDITALRQQNAELREMLDKWIIAGHTMRAIITDIPGTGSHDNEFFKTVGKLITISEQAEALIKEG